MTQHIIDTDELEKVLNKYEGTSGWASALCDDLRALIANSPQADGMVNADVIEAANDVIDKAYCDCPTSMRYDKGEHYASCPLFDLNIAMRKLSAYKPQAEKAIDPSVERALCESDATIYGRGYMLNGERIPPQDLLIFDNQNTRTKQADDVRKDAERYRWLRDSAIYCDTLPTAWCVYGDSANNSHPCDGEELDQAIDKARE